MVARQTGRPQKRAIDLALLQAAERVMETGGYTFLTIDGLMAEIGSTRPAFYRRYPNIAMLALNVMTNRFGVPSTVDTGSLHDDLLALQRNEVSMMTSPLVRNNLPGILEAVRIDSTVRSEYNERLIAPRRENVAEVLRLAVARGEILSKEVDSEYVSDLLIGPLMARALLPTGLAMDDALARRTVDTVLAYLASSPSSGSA